MARGNRISIFRLPRSSLASNCFPTGFPRKNRCTLYRWSLAHVSVRWSISDLPSRCSYVKANASSSRDCRLSEEEGRCETRQKKDTSTRVSIASSSYGPSRRIIDVTYLKSAEVAQITPCRLDRNKYTRRGLKRLHTVHTHTRTHARTQMTQNGERISSVTTGAGSRQRGALGNSTDLIST